MKWIGPEIYRNVIAGKSRANLIEMYRLVFITVSITIFLHWHLIISEDIYAFVELNMHR